MSDSGAELSGVGLEDNAIRSGRNVVVLARIVGSIVHQRELRPGARTTAQGDVLRSFVVILVRIVVYTIQRERKKRGVKEMCQDRRLT